MNRRVSFLWAWIVAVALVVPLARTGWTQAVQFDASRPATLTLAACSAVMEWRAVRGGVSLAPVHLPSNGWSLAVALDGLDGRSVDFSAEGVASPLHASGSADPVAYAFAVVRCQAPADLATLLDAPSPVRFAPTAWPDDPQLLDTSPLGGSADYAVNGVPTDVFTGADGFQLIEVAWDMPVLLEQIFVGNTPATPAWNRAWPGEIAELIVLPFVPDAEGRNALRFYAARKWGVPVTACGAGAVDTLLGLGVSPGTLFATLIKVR